MVSILKALDNGLSKDIGIYIIGQILTMQFYQYVNPLHRCKYHSFAYNSVRSWTNLSVLGIFVQLYDTVGKLLPGL